MNIAYIIVTIAAALWVGFSAYALLAKRSWVTDSMVSYGVPQSWWNWLGAAKAAGAVGLLVGLFVPFIGIAAGVGLVLYFIGALVTVLRARVYKMVPAPLMYLIPAAAALTFAVMV